MNNFQEKEMNYFCYRKYEQFLSLQAAHNSITYYVFSK